MKKYIWNGEDTNLGHHGIIKRNDVIVLTDLEVDMVTKQRDKRFRVLKDGDKLPTPGHFVEVDPDMTQAERDAANRANKKEQGRLEQLEQYNDPNNVEILEIKEMSYDKLLGIATELKLHLPKTPSRQNLIALVLENRHKRVAADEPEAGELGEQTAA